MKADFSFKQFSLAQDRCAMKVGTDGVLLGAWAEGGKRVLDIGSGTGLIALMMAQRFPEATVVGIDIDGAACSQARENVSSSPFSCRVDIVHTSLQDYALAVGESDKDGVGQQFDSIVCNPPFFIYSLRSPDPQRALARHADSLPFSDLFQGVKRLLSADGVFSAVIPSEYLEQFSVNAYLSGFYLSRKYDVKTTPKKPVRRHLVAFRRKLPHTLDRQSVCLQETDGSRSGWYSRLTSDFLLR